jgi:hypothetical protein
MSARFFVLAAGLLALLAVPEAPADTLRCGSRLVHEGDTRAEVIAKCGEPTEVQRSSIWRRPTYWYHGYPMVLGNDAVEIPVETWIYNLGSNQLMRRLRLEDGIVINIETLGYGY